MPEPSYSEDKSSRPEPASRRELRILKQIETLRISKQVEINDAVNVAQKELQMKFQEKLASEKANYEAIIAALRRKIEELATTLHEKTVLIRHLNSVIADQESILSEVNIELFKKPKDRPKAYFNEEATRKSDRRFHELKAIKEICKMYDLDCLLAKEAAKDAKAREEEQIALREADKVKHAEALRIIEETIKRELEAERLKNSQFQASASAELTLRETLNSRQQEMVKALQDELKSAKAILQSKRLHNKYLEAFKTVSTMQEVPEENGTPILRRRIQRPGKVPKALSTLPRLDRTSIDLQTSSKTPTLRHFKLSPEALTKTSTISQNSSFT